MFKFRKMRRDAAGPRLTVAGDDALHAGRPPARADEARRAAAVDQRHARRDGPRRAPARGSLTSSTDFRDEFREILRVRPGITGLSQIQYRNESALLVGDDFDELYRNELLPRKLDLDRYYARRRSLALDVRILTWTAIAVVAGARVRRNELTASVSFERHDSRRALAHLSSLGGRRVALSYPGARESHAPRLTVPGRTAARRLRDRVAALRRRRALRRA